jgi:phosphatidate cytidylyltransferase
MLGKRVLSAAILIPIVVLAVYLGGLYFLGLVVLVGVLAGIEYLRMMRTSGWTPSYLFGLLLIVLCVMDGQWPQFGLLSIGLVSVPLLALTVEVFRGNAPGSLLRWALMVAGAVYIGFAASYFIKLRALDGGLYWLTLALLGTWTCDTGAYFVGITWGRTRFFPQISPKKTWEGALGGLVTGVAVVVLLGWYTLHLHPGWGVVLGVLLVLGATFGDLAESVIKRQVGAKDSGRLIPGHGGMLDRVDSLLFVIPIVYYFAVIATNLLL